MHRPRVATITLSWNARDDLREALHRVQKQTMRPDKIIVVDSGSTDGTAEMMRTEFPNVELHALGKNIGYAAGYNKAFSLVPKNVDFTVVIDQDVVPGKDYIRKVVQKFMTEPASTAIIICDLEEPKIKTFAIKPGYIKDFHGSCYAYRNSIKALMRYDEKFFAYNNESDLSARLMNRGYMILHYPGCKIFHKKDSTVMNPFRTYLMTRNAIWHWWKNTSVPDAILGSACVMGIFYSKSSRYRTLPAYFRAVLDAFLGLPYCIKNREACKEISFKDLHDIGKVKNTFKKAHLSWALKASDYIYTAVRGLA